MTTNDSKSYFGYLNRLLDEQNNTYHCSIGKIPIAADSSVLTREIESSHKAPKFRFGDKVMITKYKIIFSKGYTKNWSKEMFAIDFMLKFSRWTQEIKELNRETIIGSF